jgi:polysaccharide biosynthesis transport protein
VDLRRQLQIVRSHLRLIVFAVAVAGGIGAGVSTLIPRVYEAQATILIGQSLSSLNPDYNQLLTSQRLTVTYASLATRRPILEKVIGDLHLNTTAEDLSNRVFAEPSQTTAFMTIVARSRDPSEAAAIANAVAEQVIAASPTVSGQQTDLVQAVEADLKATREEIAATSADVARLQAIESPTPEQRAELLTLQDRLASLRSTYATLLTFSSTNASNLLTVVEPAVPPSDPAAPNRTLITMLSALVGLLLILTAIFVAEYLNDALKGPEDVEAVLGLPTLGSIARIKADSKRDPIYSLVTLLNPRSQSAEAYRSIRAGIDFASLDAPLKTLLVASAMAGDGKTVTAANLAVVFAQSGRKVLLVDADLRLPGVHRIFNLPNARGFTNLIMNPWLEPADAIQPTEIPELMVLTSGNLPPNPAEVLGSQRATALFERLGKAFDLLVIDSPPVQAVADAAILSTRADATLLVVDARKSRRASVVRARDALARAGSRVVGVVLNRVPRIADLEAYAAYAPVAKGAKGAKGAVVVKAAPPAPAVPAAPVPAVASTAMAGQPKPTKTRSARVSSPRTPSSKSASSASSESA